MICRRCSKEFDDRVNYCPYCGEPADHTMNNNAYNNPAQNQYSQFQSTQSQYSQNSNTQQQYSQAYSQPSQYSEPFGQNPQPPFQNGYNQPPMYDPAMQNAQNDLHTAKILGIIAIIVGIIFSPLAGWICGGIAISKANKYLNYYGPNAPLSSEASSAKKLGIIGVVASSVIFVLTLLAVLSVFFGVGFLASGGEEIVDYYYEDAFALMSVLRLWF
ncbi:MAG: hypothetical protein ACI4W6_08745 [Acutalibacteraceae bacterium]